MSRSDDLRDLLCGVKSSGVHVEVRLTNLFLTRTEDHCGNARVLLMWSCFKTSVLDTDGEIVVGGVFFSVALIQPAW